MPTMYRKKFTDATSVSLAHPSKLSQVLRVAVSTTPKNISGVKSVNISVQCNEQKQSLITEGDRSVNETLSVRVSLSGSNKAELLEMWNRHKANVDAAIADGALDGFVPLNATFTAQS